MIEARIFTDEIDTARLTLEKLGAVSQGRYVIDDEVYRNRDKSISLVDEFLRIRSIPENIWDEKPFIVALKQTELRMVGKESRIPLKKQFDTKAEADAYFRLNLESDYIFDYAFSRVGWQYFLPNGDVVDLEILEDTHPSIEFKSTTDQGIEKLLGLFAVASNQVISGPSVIAFKQYAR